MSEVEKALRQQKSLIQSLVDKALKSKLGKEFQSGNPFKRIFIFGLGSSQYVAHLTQRILAPQNFPIFAGSAMDIFETFTPGAQDLCIGISHRGQTPETRAALSFAQKNQAKVLMVSGKNPTAAVITSRFETLETTELEKCEPHTMSVMGALCVITTALGGQTIADHWLKFSEEKEPDLDAWTRGVKGEVPTIILGTQTWHWHAKEFSLKLMEMARLPVRFFGFQEFIHGPRLSYQSSDTIWLLKSPQEKLELSKKITVSKTLNLANPVTALCELHWLALAVALDQRVDPDGKEA